MTHKRRESSIQIQAAPFCSKGVMFLTTGHTLFPGVPAFGRYKRGCVFTNGTLSVPRCTCFWEVQLHISHRSKIIVWCQD